MTKEEVLNHQNSEGLDYHPENNKNNGSNNSGNENEDSD